MIRFNINYNSNKEFHILEVLVLADVTACDLFSFPSYNLAFDEDIMATLQRFDEVMYSLLILLADLGLLL